MDSIGKGHEIHISRCQDDTAVLQSRIVRLDEIPVVSEYRQPIDRCGNQDIDVLRSIHSHGACRREIVSEAAQYRDDWIFKIVIDEEVRHGSTGPGEWSGHRIFGAAIGGAEFLPRFGYPLFAQRRLERLAECVVVESESNASIITVVGTGRSGITLPAMS